MCTAYVSWLDLLIFSMFITIALWLLYEIGALFWRYRTTISKCAATVWSLPELLLRRMDSN